MHHQQRRRVHAVSPGLQAGYRRHACARRCTHAPVDCRTEVCCGWQQSHPRPYESLTVYTGCGHRCAHPFPGLSLEQTGAAAADGTGAAAGGLQLLELCSACMCPRLRYHRRSRVWLQGTPGVSGWVGSDCAPRHVQAVRRVLNETQVHGKRRILAGLTHEQGLWQQRAPLPTACQWPQGSTLEMVLRCAMLGFRGAPKGTGRPR